MAIFDLVHLQGINWASQLDQKLKFWVKSWLSAVSVKIWDFQNALSAVCTTMRTPDGQNFSSIWSCLLEVLPQTHQKTVYLLGKIDTCKYPEAETWHPESIDGRSYYKLCENFWWPFGTVPWEQFRPGLGPHFFYLILQKFLDFSGTWDLRYLIFLSMQFFQDFWFLAIFLVFQLKIEPQNRPKP